MPNGLSDLAAPHEVARGRATELRTAVAVSADERPRRALPAERVLRYGSPDAFGANNETEADALEMNNQDHYHVLLCAVFRATISVARHGRNCSRSHGVSCPSSRASTLGGPEKASLLSRR